MKTKPRGIHANFTTTCECGSEITVSNGRIAPHECERRPITLAELRAALDRK